MSIDIVGAVSKVYDVVGPTLLRQCGYAIFCNNYVSDLKGEIKKLKDASIRLQHRVDRAESVKEIIEDDVLTWLSKADQLIVSGNLFLQENNVSCFGFVPNPKARYVLGRRAKKCLPTLKGHLNEGKFDEVSFHPVAEPIVEVKVRSATSSSTVCYVELKSRALVLKKIVAALDDHKKIGVYGMGGVGKTALLKEVEKIVKESGKFDDVVGAFVSQTPDIEGIKSKICNKLKWLESNGDDTSKKTLLILLDDLWEEFKGIEVLEKDTKVKVKWVMTSRKQALLAKEMFCHPTFSLGVLDEEEGWHLFRELVMSKNNVEGLMKNPTTVELLKKCAGLPVSIEALATIWKNKGLSPTDLISVEELNLDNDLEDGSVSLELSYSYLRDQDGKEEAKLLFRTIGLLGTPIVPILTLLKYTVGLDLFGSSTNDKIMERARREVIRSVCTLQDSSLLLESDDSNHVKIHDLVRDVAVRIASRDDHALIFNPEDSVKGWSREKMKDSTAVSLPYSALPMLLYTGGECPNANIFIMRVSSEQGDWVKLPDFFFKGMVKLKIIDLRNARFTSLPSSIQSDVHNLTTLCLDYCYLEDVAAIGNLKSLQVLSFVGSDIAELPEEIGGLINLRMLDLSKCLKLKSIKPGVLGRLTRLEELYLKESFNEWEIEGNKQQQSNSSLGELNNMVLSILELHVCDDSKLPSSLPLGDLVQYKVLLGDVWDWSGEYKEARTLKLKVQVKWHNIMTEEWLQSALQKIQDFHLDGLSGNKESFHEVCWEGFKELKHLHLQNCSSIKSIVWSMEWSSCVAFTTLESMYLENLERLEKICNGLISLASFSKLKVVRVQECHKLRNLFNTSFVKSLPELEEIEVSDCSLIREILIAEKMDEDDKKVMACCSDNLLCYPIKRSSEVSKTQSDAEESSCEDYEFKLDNLHSLTLRNLSELTTFFSKETPSSDSTNIPLPAFFNDQQVSLHNNDRQKLFSCSKFKEIQSSAHLALSLGTLRRVVVEDCNKIVNFIDSRMLLKLGNLDSLSIARCESLKDIFDLEGIDAESGNNKILPKLLELKLKGLPNLEHIWKKNFKQIKGCRNLRIFEIYQCDKLSYLCGSSMGKGMENLTEIEIEKCGKMETIFLDEDVSTKDVSTLIRLTSLKSLAISKCQNLKTFLSTDYSKACKCSDNGMSCWCCGKQDSILGDRSISFFSDKVSLPSLESLFLSSSGKFETLCCINLPTDRSYYNLEVVNVEWCGTLSVVFPATLIDRLQKLKQLLVRDCLKLRTIVNLDVDWKDKKRPKALMLSQLQELTLSNLVDMTHVMEPGDSDIVVAFPNLKQLTVEKCSKLMYLIPTSTATTLLKLESLDISYCKELREVIDGEVSDGYKRNVINFPHLTDLCMSGLESLTHFSSESYFFDFTCLKRIHINSCQNLKTLVKPTSSVHDSGSQATTGVQALFDNKVELPNLEKLDIKSIEVDELWCSEPQTTSFCKLKSLKVDGCSKLKYLIPTSTATTLLKLESLDIHSCKELQEVIHGEVSDGYKRNVINLPHLTDLCMSGLESLTHFSSESYLFDFPCLQRIQIDKCENLEALLKPTSSGHDLGSQATTGVQALFNNKVDLPNLEELEIGYTKVEELWCNEPLTTSFCKLKTLRVSNCGQLRNIIPSFIVKRLQTLEGMDIRECTLLDDIFKIPSKEQITSVHDSRVLEGCIIEENKHSLDKIILPKLTSLRVGNNIKLSSLQLGRYTLELTSLKELSVFQTARDTVEAIFEKAYLPNLEELKVEFTRITELWHNEPHVGSFCKLRHLQVDGCGQLTRIIPSFMLKRMKNLETLEVFNCNQLQTVAELGVLIEPQGSESKLPNSPFENLISIQVEYCECLISLFTISKRPDEIGDTSQCRDTIVLPHLTKLRLERLPNLRHLFEVPEGQYSLELSSLKEFFLISSGEKEAITQKVIFPKDLQIRDHDTFFGSTTSVAMDIRNALHKTRKNKNIIGALGRMDDYVIKELVRIVKEEEKMFDEVLDCRWESTVRIQEEIGRVLGIVYGAAGEEEIAQRLRKALLSNRNKRLLLITIDMWVTSDEIKAIGVPFEEVDPKMFKLIVMSMEKEALIKMVDQLPIQIGCKVGERLSIFTRELLFFAGELAYSKMAQLQQQELQVDSNTDNQISSFVGSNTDVMSHIINALLNTNIQIIGLFGKEGIKDYKGMFEELARIVKEEANLMFDDIVDLDGNNIDERNIWEQFRDDTGVGLPERTQLNNLGERLLKNKEKRLLLVILRDLDHELDLHQLIGIPREGLDPKLLKIILYSKNKEALHKMGVGQVIDVASLSSVYPCYYRILDRYVEKSDLRKLADECGCDYLAELLAKKLKGKGLHAWGNAFQRLKESPFEYEARRRVITSL